MNCTIADVKLLYESIAIHKAASLTLPKGLYNQHAEMILKKYQQFY